MSEALIVAIAVGTSVLYAWAFWLLYVLVMGFYRAYRSGRMAKWSLPWLAAAPVVLFAYLVDLFANWVFATLWFWDMPDSFGELVTDRLTRYIAVCRPGGRKYDHSRWICETLLDYFDPTGAHCAKTTLTGKS